MTPAADSTGSRGHAFGLALDAAFEIPGIAGQAPRAARAVRLELARELAPGPDARRVAKTGGISVDRDTDGFLIRAPSYGVVRVARTGSAVITAPAPGAGARLWRLLLVGQGLPLAAVLCGLETLHASAVVIDGRAVALAGAPGAGKSAIAAALVAHGARFFTDDVLALDCGAASGLTAYPGPALPGLDRHAEPVELAAVCLLRRTATGTRARAAPLPEPGPRDLLGTTFNAFVADPERRERHLEVTARLACGLVVGADVPGSAPPEQSAAAIADALGAL